MSDNGSQNHLKPSEPQDTGTGPRTRGVSECSITSEEDGAASSGGKRQRTTSQTYMVLSDLTSASPPKFVSLEEIMQAANGMKDMALVHQIVVDKDFKLEKVEPEPNTLHRIVKDTMHKAFWNKLRTELDEDPPNYTQAMVLLEDIKQGLFSVLLPQHTKLKQQISEVLDNDLIKQQAENGALDFRQYAQFVISIMAKLCAPVRDEKIKELTETTDVVETFKGILEVSDYKVLDHQNTRIVGEHFSVLMEYTASPLYDFLSHNYVIDLMKLDMANFTLQMARPEIIQHSVELERKKFADFLAIQTDGLEHTRKWLLKYLDAATLPGRQDNMTNDAYIRSVVKKVFWPACIDLLEWDEKIPYPETFMLDEQRIQELQYKTNRLIAVATTLLVTLNSVGADYQTLDEFKTSLKNHLLVLFQGTKDDKDLPNIMPNIAEQVILDVKEAQGKYSLPPVSKEAETLLKQQIVDISKTDHKVRNLIRQRVKEFFLDIIESCTAAPQKVPSGLTALQKEITGIAGQFLRIVSHNSSVFCIYYFDIVAKALPEPA